MTGLAEGFSGFIAGFRPAPDQGRTLEQALSRTGRQSWYDAEPEPVDPDDRISALLARGYSPGLTGRLSQQLGDTLAELETEQAKLAVTARRQEQVRRMHEAGRIDAFEVMRQLHGGDPAAEGDEGRVRQLEHQAADLRAQLADAAERVAPAPQRDLDPVEAAVSRASSAGHQMFVEATRSAMAAAGQRPAQPEPRPFGESGGGEAGEVTAPGPEVTRGGVVTASCQHCRDMGISPAEATRLHASDPLL